MAERSFKKEVQQLKIPAGEVFAGEGILAVTKALLQAGVAYVGGYQGSPISHLMDVLADAREIMGELGVHFESSASEATAAASLAASVHYPLRGAITFTSTAGTNVASDALSNLASGGVTGGTLIIIGEDYGEGSSIMQERSHAFAMKSQMWLLDPRPETGHVVDMVEKAFELSEASHTPVMFQMRIRTCHMHGRFITKENRRPQFSIAEALANPVRDLNRIVLPPASFLHEEEKIHQRWPAAVQYIADQHLNEFFGPADHTLGLVIQGGLYNNVIRALQLIGLADQFGETDIPIYVMNVTYPLVDQELHQFCLGKQAVLMLEEGQPEFIEQAVSTSLRRADIQTKLHGKDLLPMGGEYSTLTILRGLLKYFAKYQPDMDLKGRLPLGVQQALAPKKVDIPVKVEAMAAPAAAQISAVEQAEPEVHARPPGLCTGCPERPVFAAIKLMERELGHHHISSDIGCNLFSILPPFHLGATTMGYGLGSAGAAAFNTDDASKRSISIMGDGGFWHNGLTSGVGNAVFNQNDGVVIVIDNNYTAATGGQDILSTRVNNPTRTTNVPIEQAVRGMGATWVHTLTNTYDISGVRDLLKEALTTKVKGPKIIVAQSECMLNKQRRIKPLMRKLVKEGKRVERERFGVDDDVCTGDRACIRLSGCPSLSIKDNPDPLQTGPVTTVLSSCVGCGVCGENAHAAVLCPSFYKAKVVTNPGPWETFRARLNAKLIGFLQAGLASREVQYV